MLISDLTLALCWLSALVVILRHGGEDLKGEACRPAKSTLWRPAWYCHVRETDRVHAARDIAELQLEAAWKLREADARRPSSQTVNQASNGRTREDGLVGPTRHCPIGLDDR